MLRTLSVYTHTNILSNDILTKEILLTLELCIEMAYVGIYILSDNQLINKYNYGK